MKKEFKRVVITSIIQGMSLNKKALQGLRTYCDANDAELIVLPVSYKAKGFGKKEEIPFYGEGIDAKELLRRNISINEKTIIYGSIRIRPTAKRPLTGFAGFGGNANVILPHPKVGMEMEPSADKYNPKQLWTSGTISNPDSYSLSRAGAEGEFHHTLGALVIENDIIRHLPISGNGKVYDLDAVYDPNGQISTAKVAGLVLGDIHMAFQTQASLIQINAHLDRFQPTYTVVHDLLDANAVSHHNIGDAFANYAVSLKSMPIDKELTHCMCFLDDIIRAGSKPVLVNSNHHDHFTKWLNRAVWSDNMGIAKQILSWQMMMLKAIDEKDPNLGTPSAFNCLVKEEYGSKVKIVGGQGAPSFKIDGYLVDRHGHEGLNGGRGLGGIHRRSADKFIVGHSHSPKIIDGLTVVGTYSPLEMPYTGGLSTWAKAFALIYEGGRRQLVIEKPDFGYNYENPDPIRKEYLSDSDIDEDVFVYLTEMQGRYEVTCSLTPNAVYVLHGLNDLKVLPKRPGLHNRNKLKKEGSLLLKGVEWTFRKLDTPHLSVKEGRKQ